MCTPASYALVSSKINDQFINKQTLLNVVINVFNVDEDVFLSNYRGRACADARKAFMYLGFKYLKCQKKELSVFINRDHSSGLAQIIEAETLLQNNSDFRTKLHLSKVKFLELVRR
jgi:chromosomal replication initiation ATPase DnaA